MKQSDELVSEWLSAPEREIWLIDETKVDRDALPKAHRDHRGLLSYTAVRLTATRAVALLKNAEHARSKLPQQNRGKSYKSGDLWRAVTKARKRKPLQGLPRDLPLAATIALELMNCSHIVQLITTQKHVKALPAPGGTKTISEDGTERVIASARFNLVQNFILRLIGEWKPSAEPIDIVIDRASDLGLHREQEGIAEDQFNMHVGRIKEGVPTTRLIGGSDTGPALRDLLLLPDFFGYMIREYQQANTAHALAKVFSDEIPFHLVAFDVPEMIRRTRSR